MIIPGGDPTPTAIRTLHANQAGRNQSVQRLATGQRINSGKDDPAGLITSENLRAVLAALEAESRSLQRTDHVAATADAALGEVSDQLIRAEALEVRNANDAGLSDAEREANAMEIRQIRESVNRQVNSASFNGQPLFNGEVELSAAGGEESLALESLSLGSLGGTSEERLETLRNFREEVNTMRGEIGAFSKNVIGSQLNRIAEATENLTEAESIIRDTDFARETAELARFEVLTESSLRMLSFMNSSADDVLSLLA